MRFISYTISVVEQNHLWHCVNQKLYFIEIAFCLNISTSDCMKDKSFAKLNINDDPSCGMKEGMGRQDGWRVVFSQHHGIAGKRNLGVPRILEGQVDHQAPLAVVVDWAQGVVSCGHGHVLRGLHDEEDPHDVVDLHDEEDRHDDEDLYGNDFYLNE